MKVLIIWLIILSILTLSSFLILTFYHHGKPLVSSKENDRLDLEHIIDIANKEAELRGYHPENLLVSLDVDNKSWDNFLRDEPDPNLAKKYDLLLKGRDYQVVYFSSVEESVFQGDLWLCIDRKSGQVIASFP